MKAVRGGIELEAEWYVGAVLWMHLKQTVNFVPDSIRNRQPVRLPEKGSDMIFVLKGSDMIFVLKGSDMIFVLKGSGMIFVLRGVT